MTQNSLDPIVEIVINDKKYLLKPSFIVLDRIEHGLNQGIMSYINERIASKKSDLHKTYNMKMSDMFVILDAALPEIVDREILKSFIFDNQLYCLQICYSFLVISFRGNGENNKSKKSDLKKK